jgi:hypothetical protein
MTQKISVEIVDDIDGSPATQTVPFGLDGVNYEIDLSDANAGVLRAELEPYVAAGRRTGGHKVRVATGQPTTATPADRDRNLAIRAWAKGNGYELSDRGRIPSEVIARYNEAQTKPSEPARRRAPRKKIAAIKK